MTNPIPELVSDQIFTELKRKHFLHETNLRNYLMRKKYKQYREKKIKSETAIEMIQSEYQYLSYGSIMEIVKSKI